MSDPTEQTPMTVKGVDSHTHTGWMATAVFAAFPSDTTKAVELAEGDLMWALDYGYTFFERGPDIRRLYRRVEVIVQTTAGPCTVLLVNPKILHPAPACELCGSTTDVHTQEECFK